MGLDPVLEDLERRLSACIKADTSPNAPTRARVSEVDWEYNGFVDLYRSSITPRHKRQFLNSLHRLADTSRFSENDAGRILFIDTQVLHEGRKAYYAKEWLEGYCPVNHVFNITTALPYCVLQVAGDKREMLLWALGNACNANSAPQFSNPMEVLSRIDAMLQPMEINHDHPHWYWKRRKH